MVLNHDGNSFKHGCVSLITHSMVLKFPTMGNTVKTMMGSYDYIDVIFIHSIM